MLGVPFIQVQYSNAKCLLQMPGRGFGFKQSFQRNDVRNLCERNKSH